MQIGGLVPPDVEYGEFPRGRVIFNTKTEKFILLADRCILQKRDLVKRIMAAMELPVKKTEIDTDPHHRCYRCLGYKN
jgi:hypothetical protein